MWVRNGFKRPYKVLEGPGGKPTLTRTTELRKVGSTKSRLRNYTEMAQLSQKRAFQLLPQSSDAWAGTQPRLCSSWVLSLLTRKPKLFEGLAEVLRGGRVVERSAACSQRFLYPLSLCSASFPVGTDVLRPVRVAEGTA